jgi:hypothetical protein
VFDLAELRNSLDGDLVSPDSSGYPRLAAVKNAYDPHRFFDFPQAI